jgi:formylglycine-generating enzyme required for sulfatase activity
MRLVLAAAAFGFLACGPLVLPAVAQSTDGLAAGRVALVVGASNYDEDRAAREAQGFLAPPSLPNAARDAEVVGDALEAAGFEVQRLVDPSKRDFLAAVTDFAARLRDAGEGGVGVFYFAGHGAQGRPPLERDIENYLIPVDADLVTEADLESEALGLSRISAALSAGDGGAVILILDACRDFALPQADRGAFNVRGLAEAKAAPGMLVAYSTRPGGVADDGPSGGNGPYAAALAREVRDARADRIEDVLIAVRNEVLTATGGDQQPWENSSLTNPVWIGGSPVLSSSADQIVFAALNGECEYAVFVRDYPSSALAGLARTRARGATPCDESSNGVVGGPSAPAHEDLAAAAFAAAASGASVAERVFAECADCPAMMAIPSGSFRMGSPAGEAGREDDEDDRAGPGGEQPRVTIPAFAVGRYEVTFAEWDACAADGGCSLRPEDHWGRGSQPANHVAWEDAQEYVRWLSAKTGETYRLLTEAEWEYAARAETSGPFSFHGAMAADDANFNGERTVEVGSYPANAFGLHDMHGNVFEWVEDCYAASYADAPTDGSAVTAESCTERVMRGGSWNYDPSRHRSANRAKSGHDHGHDYIGFRVARSL